MSDSGSDAEEFRSNIAEFDRSVREFLETHYQRRVDTGNYQPATYGRGRSGPRGPRKAVGPTGDLKSRLGQASQAFASERYDDALDLLFEVIRINAETHQAWVMLASVFREFGDADRALNAMVYACHLRPKDVEGWIACASFALDGPHEWRTRNLTAASLCYAAALRADPKSRVARLGKAAVCHERGFLNQALAEYRVLLNENPLDIGTIRLMAEVCLAKSDAAGARSAVDMTLDAYRQCIALLRPKGVPAPEQFGWVDVSAYVRLYAVNGSPLGAIAELSSLARWLLGRQDESFWDGYLDDDREWDSSDERRMCIPDFSAGRSSPRRYGDGLPLDLRALLAEYRLRTGNIAEAKVRHLSPRRRLLYIVLTKAQHHLSFLEPSEASTVSLVSSQPQLFSELASHLLDAGLVHESRGYYELIRAAFPSATVLLQLGRCHLRLHNRPAAEELFLEAINVDEDNIDARVELATMYELAKEDEEAFILVNEALGLLAKMDLVRTGRRPYARRGPGSRTSRHRPRRLVEPRERVEAEKARAALVRDKFIAAQSLREQLEQGDESTIDSWMHLAKELIDDFRQVKHFYSWDRYLRNIGLSEHGGESRETERQERSLSSMAERLSRST